MSNRSILDILENRSEPQPAIDGDVVERLRVGQAWLTRKWLQLQDQEEWTEEEEFKFWLNYEKWDRMERQAQESGQIEDCPIGPEGCHEDAPIRCAHCAGEHVVHTPDMPADSPEPETARIIACDRKGPPKVVEVAADPEAGQQSLFSMSGRVH